MTFEFATAGRILFGRGKSQQIPALARDLGRRALVVLGGSSRGRKALTEGLFDAGVRPVVFNVSGEPTTHLVDQATGIARAEGCDFVISVGGGSVIDAGKAVACMLANPGEVRDYLELVGGGKQLLERGPLFIAVPTTAGTGTEVTSNAVLDVPEHKVKARTRSCSPAGPAGRCRSRAHPVAPACDHRLHRHVDAADTVDRTVCQQRRQPVHRLRLPRMG